MVEVSRIERAIEIVNDSRRSHETWIEWYRQRPDQEPVHAETCGDTAWHRQCIEGYNQVLGVLAEAIALVELIQSLRHKLQELKVLHDSYGEVIPAAIDEGTAAGINAAIAVFEAELLMAASR